MNCIEITTKIGCINCYYCPQEKLLEEYKGTQYLTFNNFKKYIDKISNYIKIHFSGFGEPFFNKECIKMIEYCNKRRYKIGIYSTTIGMNEDIINRLQDIKIDPFILHLPDTAKNLSLKIWEDIFERNLKLLDKYRIKYKILMVENIIQDMRVIKRLKLKKSELILQPKISRAGNLWQSERKTGKLECDEKRYNQNILLPNGKVYLCCMDYGLEYCLGDLNKVDYYDLFESKKYKEVIERLKDDTEHLLCRYCNRAIGIK